MTSFAPRAANSCAMAKPRPREPPVMATTFPAKLGTARVRFHSSRPIRATPMPAAVPATPKPAADASNAFLSRMRPPTALYPCLFSSLDLAEVQQSHDGHAAADIARCRQRQPLQKSAERHGAGKDRRHDLSRAGDAVRKVPDTDHKGHKPDDGDLPDGPMAGGDHPRHQRDEPAADHA